MRTRAGPLETQAECGSRSVALRPRSSGTVQRGVLTHPT